MTSLISSFHYSRHVPRQSLCFSTGMQVLTTTPCPLLQARAKATAALQSAIDARDLASLEIAISMALKIGFVNEGFVNELVQRAQHLASQLVEQQTATRALADALQSNDLDSLKAALADAVRLMTSDDL